MGKLPPGKVLIAAATIAAAGASLMAGLAAAREDHDGLAKTERQLAQLSPQIVESLTMRGPILLASLAPRPELWPPGSASP